MVNAGKKTKKTSPDPLHVPLSELKGSVHEDDFRPSWRGWIHTGVLPFVVAAGILLIIFADGWQTKIAASVYLTGSFLLFGGSALYHRFNWGPTTKRVLKRIDHANIFLLIAGTYTPLTVAALPSDKGWFLLTLVWSIAVVGIGFRLIWVGAPRWLYVPIYVLMGWAAVIYITDLWDANWVMMLLIVIGGIAYTVGAVIYGMKRPNPVPNHFGFHEIFHALTVVAFICHWVGALLVVTNPIPGSIGG